MQLDDAQIAELDRLAETLDDSRSELIRQAIDLYVEAVRERVDDLRYAQAYERLPEDLEESAGLRSLALHAWPKD